MAEIKRERALLDLLANRGGRLLNADRVLTRDIADMPRENVPFRALKSIDSLTTRSSSAHASRPAFKVPFPRTWALNGEGGGNFTFGQVVVGALALAIAASCTAIGAMAGSAVGTFVGGPVSTLIGGGAGAAAGLVFGCWLGGKFTSLFF